MNYLDKIIIYRYNLIQIIALLILLYSLEWLLFYLIENRIGLQIQNYSWASHFFLPIIIVSIRVFQKNGQNFKLLAFPFFLLFLYCFASVLYFRTYNQLLPLQSILYFENFSSLNSSILGSIHTEDSVFLVPIFFYFILYNFFKKVVKPESLKFRTATLFILTLPILLPCFTIWKNDINKVYFAKEFDNLFFYDQFDSAKYNGILPLWLWELSQSNNLELNKKQVIYYKKKLVSNKIHHKSIVKNKPNVIIILVESLESWVLKAKYKNLEITPYLNSFICNDSVFSFVNMKHQTFAGRSSDAQLIINTGLLPIKNGATCFKYPNNKFPSIMTDLKKSGYNSSIYLGGSSTFWNYKHFAIAQGFDRVYDQMDFNFSEKDFFHFGILDHVFLSQTADKLKKLKQPFISEIITLTSHMPFVLPDNINKKKFGKDCDILNYINSVNYTDRAIGLFLFKLKKMNLYKNSIIIITGDHTAFTGDNHFKCIDENLLKIKFKNSKQSIPFIIKNNLTHGITDNECLQMDIYRTLSDLLKVNNNFIGFGNNLFTKKKKTNQNIQKIQSISDTLIRSNFFNNLN